MSYEAGATLAEEMSTITFTEEEARRVCQPHDDALVVTLRVGHNNVHRILIDGGSSVDVMCKSTFQKMELTIDMLKPSPTPLYGFAGKKVIPEGSIELPISIGQTEHQKALMVRFLVVDTPSVYNIILGRPTLNALKAVVSTYHLLMKFPVAGGVGEVRGDQHEARKCLAIALREESLASGEVRVITTEEQKGNPDLGPFDLSSSDPQGPEQPPSNLPHAEPTSVGKHEAYLTQVLEGQTHSGPRGPEPSQNPYQRRIGVVQDQDPTINFLKVGLLKQLLIHQKDMEKKIHALMTKLQESKRQKIEGEVEMRKLSVNREMSDVTHAVEQHETQVMSVTMSQPQPESGGQSTPPSKSSYTHLR